MKTSFRKPGEASAVPAKPTPAADKAAPTPAPKRAVPPAATAQPPEKPAPAAPVRRAALPPARRVAPPVEETQQPELIVDNAPEVVEELDGGGEEAISVVETGSAIAVVPGSVFSGQIGTITGEVSANDFSAPRLKLAQNVGPLTEEHGFTPGDFVLSDELILWQPECAPVEITILRAHKQLLEKTEYGGDAMGRIFETAAEAEAEGLTTQWGPNNTPPDVAPQMTFLIAIKQGDGVEGEAFNLEGTDGNRYALALWRIGGVSYGTVVQRVTGAQRVRLKDGLHTGTFLLTAAKIKGRKNTYWAPTLDPGEAHDADMQAWLSEQLGGTGQAAE